MSSNGTGDGDDNGDGRSKEPSAFQRVVTVVSVVVTVGIFALVIWQALTTPASGVPEVSVADTTPMENGSVRVAVELTNPSATGFDIVTASVDCTDPPTSLTFSHVPAGGQRTGHVVCPRWNGSTTVSVSSWIEA